MLSPADSVEWENLNTAVMRRNYVSEKLEKEGGINIMKTAGGNSEEKEGEERTGERRST